MIDNLPDFNRSSLTRAPLLSRELLSKMMSRLFSTFSSKTYDHEFLIFGPSYQKGRPMLIFHSPSDTIHVISSQPRLSFQTELLGDANLLAGGTSVDLSKLREAAESVILILASRCRTCSRAYGHAWGPPTAPRLVKCIWARLQRTGRRCWLIQTIRPASLLPVAIYYRQVSGNNSFFSVFIAYLL